VTVLIIYYLFLCESIKDLREGLVKDGLGNPLAGEGIDYALESGEIAAKHLYKLLMDGDNPAQLSDYASPLEEKYTPIFNFSNKLTTCCLKPFMLNTMVGVANKRKNLKYSS
jgi:flavin-dependent dehydrogenase